MQLIPQWRVWYKRWSTWLLLVLSGMNLNDILGWLPSIQQYVDPTVYRYTMLGLSIATFLVLQIRQKSVSGPKV